MGSYMLIDDGLGYYETNINSIFIDAMFKYQGFSFMAEYANRQADNPIAVNSDGSETGDVVDVGDGLNLVSGYLFDNDVELTGRYTTISLDKEITGSDLQSQYTFGLSKYFKGHKLKVQTDVSYLDIENNDTSGLMYRMQFELHF